MKQIEAIIRTSKFDAVIKSLHEVEVFFLSYFDVKGVGYEKAIREYRGHVYDAGFIGRIMLKIVVKDENVDKTVKAILNAGKTGEIGDGQIYIMNVEQAIRIRDSENLKEIED